MDRREFLKTSLLAAGATALPACGDAGTPGPEPPPDPDDLELRDIAAHILATVSHESFLVKVSLTEPADSAPELWVDGVAHMGQRTDTDGRFWAFRVDGLPSSTVHTLTLVADGQRLHESWELRTFPAPDDDPNSFRLLIYTCAGGCDVLGLWQRMEVRRALLDRGLSFEPDAVVAVGDHVYWDLTEGITAQFMGRSETGIGFAGEFDREQAVLGTDNEAVLKKIVDCQVTQLYGTRFKSLPMFLLQDDHDYFENDHRTTFPPGPFGRGLAEASQRLWYPEFLPDRHRSHSLPGGLEGVDSNRSFGTLRYGKLFEALLYDCKGYLELEDGGGVVPEAVEDWLLARTADRGVTHVVHIPSNPPGWARGGFAEWYPDERTEDGGLTLEIPKEGWNPGWLAQHDRLLAAASEHRPIPLFLSGDVHGTAEGKILRSGELDLSANPVISVITGTPATSSVGWPSVLRGVPTQVSGVLEVEEVVSPLEENGFHIVEFTRTEVRIQHFRWDVGSQSIEDIGALAPFRESVYVL